MFLNPQAYSPPFSDEQMKNVMEKMITFFERKGLAEIKEDDQASEWYEDFITFIKENKLFFQLLTPEAYGEGEARFDLSRVCEMTEILAFYSLSYQYAYQVSILGLGPIWMANNEEVKNNTAQHLKAGGIFAFGMSEKAHGADLYSNEMKLHRQDDGTYLATGDKFYIGNANEAALVSVFGRIADTEEFVFFVVDPNHDKYLLKEKIHTSGVRTAFVGEFALDNYPITNDEILSVGRHAWDTSLSTINIGKFQLGFASVGICEHAFYEAIDHATERVLYGKKVTEFPHLKALFTEAYTRTVAMKLFARRAVDYFRSSTENDRRYLLFNPIQKMKVTTQGVEVIDMLLDVVAAKGFEQETYMETAIRDIGMIPRLEGTTHVNMALVIKFVENYFFNNEEYREISSRMDNKDDANLFQQTTGKLAKVTFPNYRKVYKGVALENVTKFAKQVDTFRDLLETSPPSKEQRENTDFVLHFGELFANIVYAQLILENAKLYQLKDVLVNQMFDFLVRDQSKVALVQRMKFAHTTVQDKHLQEMVQMPASARKEKNELWTDYVLALKGRYHDKK